MGFKIIDTRRIELRFKSGDAVGLTFAEGQLYRISALAAKARAEAKAGRAIAYRDIIDRVDSDGRPKAGEQFTLEEREYLASLGNITMGASVPVAELYVREGRKALCDVDGYDWGGDRPKGWRDRIPRPHVIEAVTQALRDIMAASALEVPEENSGSTSGEQSGAAVLRLVPDSSAASE